MRVLLVVHDVDVDVDAGVEQLGRSSLVAVDAAVFDIVLRQQARVQQAWQKDLLLLLQLLILALVLELKKPVVFHHRRVVQLSDRSFFLVAFF